MKCKICGSNSQHSFTGEILSQYKVAYYECPKCNFLQMEEPYWLDEAYSKPINDSDTGLIFRNIFYSKKISILLYLTFGKNGKYLDYAGGYGIFVRLMRDIGYDFYWKDKYTQNLFAKGYEWNPKTKVDAVTLFEAFEHFTNPIKEIENLLNISNTIIFSTELHPNPTPKPEDWWYYGLDHGQHISFFSKESLEFIAKKFGLNYYNLGSLHILSRNKISKFKLLAIKLSRFGLDKLIARFIDSRTWADYENSLKETREQ